MKEFRCLGTCRRELSQKELLALGGSSYSKCPYCLGQVVKTDTGETFHPYESMNETEMLQRLAEGFGKLIERNKRNE